MSDENGGETKEINSKDVQAQETTSESKIKDKTSSNKHTEVDKTTHENQEQKKIDCEELDKKNNEIEKIDENKGIEKKEKLEDIKQENKEEKEKNKSEEITISDVTETNKKSEDIIKTKVSDMAEKQEKDTSIKSEEKKVTTDTSDQRKSIFKDGQSKSDVQENSGKNIQSKSYIKDADKTPQQNKSIIKDTQNRSVEPGSEHKDKKVHIVIDTEDKSVSMKSGTAMNGGDSSSEEGEDSDAKCDVEMNGKVKDVEQDNTACESDVDSDKDCMLNIKDMDHARENDENRNKGGALFGLSLSKLLRRRYIVVLGILLGGCMLGIILFGVIHSSMDHEENMTTEASIESYDKNYSSSSENPASINSDDVGVTDSGVTEAASAIVTEIPTVTEETATSV